MQRCRSLEGRRPLRLPTNRRRLRRSRARLPLRTRRTNHKRKKRMRNRLLWMIRRRNCCKSGRNMIQEPPSRNPNNSRTMWTRSRWRTSRPTPRTTKSLSLRGTTLKSWFAPPRPSPRRLAMSQRMRIRGPTVHPTRSRTHRSRCHHSSHARTSRERPKPSKSRKATSTKSKANLESTAGRRVTRRPPATNTSTATERGRGSPC